VRAIVLALVLASPLAHAGDCDLADAAGGSWSTYIASMMDACQADPTACQAAVPPRAEHGSFATGEATLATLAEARTGTAPLTGGELVASGRAGWHSGFQVCGHTTTVVAQESRGDWALAFAWPHGFAPLEISLEQQWQLRPRLDGSRIWLRRVYSESQIHVDYAVSAWQRTDGSLAAALPFRFAVRTQDQEHTGAVFQAWWFAAYESRSPEHHTAVLPATVEAMYANGTGTDADPTPATSWLADIEALELTHRFGDTTVELSGGYLTASVPLHTTPIAAAAAVAWGPWSLRAERSAHLAMDEVITIEDRLSAGFHDGRWRAGAFAAATRTTADTHPQLTGGGSAGLDLLLPQKLKLALDVEVARSYYARLDADPEPRPELAGTGTVRLTRHFTVNPTAH
jgi:hypothetical protein